MQSFEQQQLTQRKVVATLVLVVAAGAGVFLFSKYQDKVGNVNTQPIPDDQVAVTTVAEPQFDTTQDLDTDGLPDWQEILFGSDPRNPDTNGDGVGDLEDFQKSQQELSDSLANSQQATTQSDIFTFTNTDAIAQNMYAAAALLAQTQNGLDSAEADTVAQLVYDEMIREPEYNLTPLGEFTFFQNSNDGHIGYVNDLITMIELYAIERSGIEIIEQAITNNDLVAYQDLDVIINEFEDMLGYLFATQPTQAFAQFHIEAVHAIERIITNLYGIQTTPKDPVVGLRNFNAYKINYDYLIDLVDEFFYQNVITQ